MANATLRCATRINSSVPSRIVNADLTQYGREGRVLIKFTYEEKPYEFDVPFTRPYLSKSDQRFANLLNLNQQRQANNEAFQEFIIQITNNYQIHPAIEIDCYISKHI